MRTILIHNARLAQVRRALYGAAALALLVSGILRAGPATATAAAPVPGQLGSLAITVGASVSAQQAQKMQLAGVQVVYLSLSWGQVQPAAGASYHWNALDSSLAALAHWNIGAVLIVHDNPPWAATVPGGPVDRVPVQTYYDFVTAAAQRYSGPAYTVQGWVIYNEPDANTNWGHQAAAYVDVLSHDYAIIKSQAPNAMVMIGGLAYDHFEDQGGPFVRDFLANVLQAGGGAYLDAVTFHHYPATLWPSLGAVLASLRATLAGAGLAKPLYWIETGASSDPFWGGSLTSQAIYVPKAYASGLGSGVGSVAWFPFQDFDDAADFYFTRHGLLAVDGSPKPAYTAYQVAAGYLATSFALRPQDVSELGGNPAAEAYNFIRADGTSVSVGWANGSTAAESWPAGHVLAVQDLAGNPLAVPPPANGLTTIPLADSPVYIALDRACRFGDVPWDFWARSYIEPLCWQGVISGYADGTFRPYTNATRGQISKMVVLGMGWAIDTSAGQVFADVPPSNPFYGYIATAYAHGIISGYADGTFHPGANVTRGQLSKMLTLAKGWPLPQPRGGFSGDIRGRPTPTPTVVPILQDFVDVPPANPFYGYIEAVYQHGVVSGYADHTFRPFNYTTRAQLSKMILNTITSP